MIETELDRRPAETSVTVAGILAGVLAVVVAATFGLRAVSTTLAGLAGAVAVIRGWSIVAVDPETTPNRKIALASIAVAVGGLGLLVPLVWLPLGEALLLVPLVWAVLFVGLEGVGSVESGPLQWLTRICWRSRDLVAVFTVLVLAIDSGAAWAVARGSVYGANLVVGTTGTGALLALLAECYLLLYFLPRARSVLEERAGLESDSGLRGVVVGSNQLDELLTSVRREIHDSWQMVGGGAVLLIVFRSALDTVLLSIPVVGEVLWLLLTSGLLHWLVGIVLLPAIFTVALGFVHAFVLANRSIDPPRTVASGTGGVVLGLLALPTVLVPDPVTASVLPPALTDVGTSLGLGTVVLGGIALLLLILPILLLGIPMGVSGLRVTAERTAGFVTASLLVLVGTVVGALQSVPELLVFVGVAVAVLTWDLGEQASYLGVHLGRDVDTRGPELAHGFASLAVGGVGVGLAALTAYLVGPVRLPSGSGRAYVALALALVAALGFSLSLSRS